MADPRFANIGYLPTEGLTPQLINHMAEEQQARIATMGQLRADSEGIPFSAMLGAKDAFLGGRALARSEESQNQQRAINDQVMAQRKQDMERNAGLMSEEQKMRELRFGSGDVNSSRAAREMDDLHAARQQGLDIGSHGMLTDDQRLAMERQRLFMDQGSASFNLSQAKISAAAQQLQATVGGIQNDSSLSPVEKAAKIKAVQDQYAAALGPAGSAYAQGIGSNAALAATQAQNSAATGNRAALESLSAFQTMKPEAGKAVAQSQAVKSLGDLADQYTRGQSEGIHALVPNFAGKMGSESTTSQTARAAAADAADTIQPGLGASIRESALSDVPARIKAVQKIAAQQVKRNWEKAAGVVPPQVKGLAEYQQAEQAVASLKDIDEAGGEDKNKPLGPQSPGGKRSVADILKGGPQPPAGTAYGNAPTLPQAPVAAPQQAAAMPPPAPPPGVAAPNPYAPQPGFWQQSLGR